MWGSVWWRWRNLDLHALWAQVGGDREANTRRMGEFLERQPVSLTQAVYGAASLDDLPGCQLGCGITVVSCVL